MFFIHFHATAAILTKFGTVEKDSLGRFYTLQNNGMGIWGQNVKHPSPHTQVYRLHGIYWS